MSNYVEASPLGSHVGNGHDRPASYPTKLQRFPPHTRKRIEHLIQIQKDHDELKAQFYKDRGALEAKYEILYQPLYDKRYNIVNGIGITTSESAKTNEEDTGIPDFWYYALIGDYVINQRIEHYDQGPLKHLMNIKWLRTDNLKVFKLEFYFRPNPFFKNSVLTVTYHMIDEDEFIIEKIIGTEIEWTSKNRLKKRRTGNRKSFFDIFSPPEANTDCCKGRKLKDILQGNYVIGSMIRDDIITRAILWFTGEAQKEQYEEVESMHKDFLKSLSVDVQKRVDLLRKLQKDHDGLKAQFYRERAELEANYQKAYNNMYNERYGIVNGFVEAEKLSKDSEIINQEIPAPEEKVVPNFWRDALVNHELIDSEISNADGEALKYLTDIKWLRKDDLRGFMLEFCFDKNPFFRNSVLTKTYQFLDEDETILHKATGIEIEWYPGNCLTRECESFFNFFNPVKISENALNEVQEVMRRDYYIGSTIRNEIIPRAVLWYLGEAIQGDKEVGLKEYEESDVDEVSEDEESEDEEDEEEG